MLTPCVVSSTPAPSIPCTSQLRGSAPTSRKLVKTSGSARSGANRRCRLPSIHSALAERDRREVDVDDLRACLERSVRQPGPPTRSGGLRRGEERVELASRVRLVETHPPGELTLLVVPRRLVRGLDHRRCSLLELVDLPLAGQDQRRTEAATRRQRKLATRRSDRSSCRPRRTTDGHRRAPEERRSRRSSAPLRPATDGARRAAGRSRRSSSRVLLRPPDRGSDRGRRPTTARRPDDASRCRTGCRGASDRDPLRPVKTARPWCSLNDSRSVPPATAGTGARRSASGSR